MKLQELQKKGQSKVNSKITYLVGALIVVVMATAIAPEMFSNVANVSGCEGVVNCTSSTPDWVPSVLFVIVGAGLVFMIWRAFGNNK